MSALIDTGAQVSVMSAQLRSRLRKVLTPATSCVRVADGGTAAIAGMCTARVTIAGHDKSVLFPVLYRSTHDLILGQDFLSDHSALIDCSLGLVHLDLPLSPIAVGEPLSRLCCLEDALLPPQAMSYVPLCVSPPVHDGDYVISPITAVLLERNVALPHTVVTIKENRTYLPFLNFSFSTKFCHKPSRWDLYPL